ncbi:hypothetical protein J27TS7_05170 [Paenibacillus dendritiformis]|nr:hypothetical protein J27TS7_05170 [Paenibacillus dendritiformis]
MTLRRIRRFLFFSEQHSEPTGREPCSIHAVNPPYGNAEFESIHPILVGELKAIDMVINEFIQLFEIHISEAVEASRINSGETEAFPPAGKDSKSDAEKGRECDETHKQLYRFRIF